MKDAVERAVAGLHAAIDFASAFDDEPDIDDIAAEADGAASLEAVDGQVRVQLNTAAGPATLLVPSTALAGDAAALSVEDFVGALVEAAFAEHDKDGNGTIEQEEFVAFAQEPRRVGLYHNVLGGHGTVAEEAAEPAKKAAKKATRKPVKKVVKKRSKKVAAEG